MKRTLFTFLEEWLDSGDRKPLVIRGARQVGKTWIVRHLAESRKKKLIELNFEKKPQLAGLLSSNDPNQILLRIGALFELTPDPKNCILFFDEIQVVPELFAKLRWFAEEMPEMPVIAAGSLLDFVLADHTFSMPVGRISYMHLEPLSFEEFLQASSKGGLLNYLGNYQIQDEIPYVVHEELITSFKKYLIIGGMPAAVSSWINQRSLQKVSQVHHDLLSTYRDDISKYRGRLGVERIEEVMAAIPKCLGEKFVYTKVNPSAQIPSIKQSLELLCKARICHKVVGSAANGIPLSAEIQEKFLKMIYLDVGLCSATLGISLEQFQSANSINLINKGGIAEQVVGQILRTIFPPYVEPGLYYWHREEKGSSAEVDYVIQHENNVIPVEVKAGSTGSLKSLHVFMGAKGLPFAVRVNSDTPSLTAINIKDHQGHLISYTLLSVPFYLLGQLHRLIKDSATQKKE